MKATYKKPLATFIGILVLFILVTVMAGCGKKPMASDVTIKENTTKEQNTSSTNTTVNGAVNDTLTIGTGIVKTGNPDCDTLCQQEVDRLFSELEFAKSSGQNSYGIMYDKYNKLLKMYANLAETKNQTVDVEKIKEVTAYYNITTTKYITKTPAFMRYSAYFGWAMALIVIYWIYTKIKTWRAGRTT